MTAEELLHAFRRGDERAVRRLYDEYGRMVYAVAYRQLGNAQQAEDATQQTFVQAWRAAGSIDPTREVGPWLAVIARRVAIDVYRSEARRAHSDIDELRDVGVSDDTERLHRVWAVRAALDRLGAEDRELIRLLHLEGHSQQAVADHLGIPVGTVKSRSFKAHQRFVAAFTATQSDADTDLHTNEPNRGVAPYPSVMGERKEVPK